MFPEQVGSKSTDGRSDLYAYGLILYEMVTGNVPFTGDSTLKAMYQKIQEKSKSPKLVNEDLPNWLVRIMMRCLEGDPADRYQTAYEILGICKGQDIVEQRCFKQRLQHTDPAFVSSQAAAGSGSSAVLLPS